MKLAHSRAIALGVFVVGTASVAGACLMSSTDGPATRHTAATGSGATMPKATLGPSKERTATKDVRGAATVAPAARSLALETGTAPRAGAPSSSDHGHAALAGGAEESSAAASPVAALASRRDLTPEQREKLAAALGKVDWNQALKDLVAAVKAARAQGQNPDPDTFVEGAEIPLALAEAAKALGLKGPGQALADPNVRSVVVRRGSARSGSTSTRPSRPPSPRSASTCPRRTRSRRRRSSRRGRRRSSRGSRSSSRSGRC
ncbi:MAG TPA: hypothetical protein VFF73_27220 [Planctomycetota bacterium]|nr:hypothetical protein [Planctomycetota bacterium]